MLKPNERLGKITSAEYGYGGGGPDTKLGLKVDLSFEGEASGLFIGEELAIKGYLTYAKVENVSQLKGKPVAVTVDAHTVQFFRILTEVL
jgi:hypothetical protein